MKWFGVPDNRPREAIIEIVVIGVVSMKHVKFRFSFYFQLDTDLNAEFL